MTKNKKNFISISLIILLVLISILYITLNGKTTIINSKTNGVESEAIICESNTFIYPYFHDDKKISSNTKVNIVIYNSEISSIGLIYTTTYQSEKDVNNMYNSLMSDINILFSNYGLSFGALNNKFSTHNNQLIFSIFAETNEIDEKTNKFFLLKSPYDTTNIKESITSNYTQQNFDCKTK